MYKKETLTPLQLKQKNYPTRYTKKQPFPQQESTQSMKSISVEWSSFINNLDSNQSKYTKNAFRLCMDSTPPSKASLFLTQTDQNKHKRLAFQTVLRFLPTKDHFHSKKVSLTEEGNTQYTSNKVKNSFHTSLVFSQWRRRWSMDSSCA